MDIPDPGPIPYGEDITPVEKPDSPGFKLWYGVLGLLISIIVKRDLRK